MATVDQSIELMFKVYESNIRSNTQIDKISQSQPRHAQPSSSHDDGPLAQRAPD